MDAPSVFEFDGFESKILRGVFLLRNDRFYVAFSTCRIFPKGIHVYRKPSKITYNPFRIVWKEAKKNIQFLRD
jgi:hypothetical protein